MNYQTPHLDHDACKARVNQSRLIVRPPPKLDLIEWSDRYRFLAAKTTASPGRWKTIAQPCAFGPMAAVLRHDTHTVSVMAGTQIIKTEFLINVAGYFIAQDPSAILFVQPTQSKAEEFSKERFAPTVEVSPQLRNLVEPPRSRDSENTITHKEFPGGVLNFVGANSPSDLASRPVRIVLADEIDKYPPSAGSEGDPLKLAEERASTYKALGRAKFVRTCSPTIKGMSRIGREYEASDQRRLYVACPHCEFEQTLSWANVRWDRGEANEHLPQTAAIACAECGALWSERERVGALDALADAPGYGWRQTAPFVCCGEKQVPSRWNAEGRSICVSCETPSAFSGHAGFHVSKLYSKRQRLPEIVQEFLDAGADQESLKKWTNSALAEMWEPKWSESFDNNKLISRAEPYDGDDLPEAVKVITGFCDVQGDRLEVQLIGWGADEEAWPFQYTIIHQDPVQPQAWRELDILLASKFKTVSGRPLRIASFGIDFGGNHGAQSESFCRARRGRRIFLCKGIAGAKPIWPGRASKTKNKQPLFLIGVDTAKEAIYARLNIDPPEPGFRKPGFIHFPVAENFGPDYFKQLNSERRQIHIRMGQKVARWVQVEERNEALDTFVGALAMRKSLPRFIEAGLEYSVQHDEPDVPRKVPDDDDPEGSGSPPIISETFAEVEGARMRQDRTQTANSGFVRARNDWMRGNK